MDVQKIGCEYLNLTISLKKNHNETVFFCFIQYCTANYNIVIITSYKYIISLYRSGASIIIFIHSQ